MAKKAEKPGETPKKVAIPGKTVDAMAAALVGLVDRVGPIEAHNVQAGRDALAAYRKAAKNG